VKEPSSLRGYVFGLGRYAALSAIALLVFLAVAPLACSSSSSAGCDSSKCATGNKCIDTGTGTAQCELICAKQTDCPANYFCGPTKDGSTNYCQPSGVSYKSAPGQWGATCNPTGGLNNNPDCDVADQFWCYGRNPTDDQAFCTQYQCNTDKDCGDDYVCTTINTFPDVRSAKPQYGQTTTVCLPRTYCEPCNTDVDCVPPTPGQTAQCTTGTDNVKFCSYQCQNDGNCPQDAACDATTGLCLPRAGVCVGNGMLCSPCRSDKDCAAGGGVCATQEYSGERYCTQKSPTPCTVSNSACKSATAYCTETGEDSSGNITYGCTDDNSTTCSASNNVTHFGCPTTTVENDQVSCSIDSSDPNIPQDQCFGLINFGTGDNANEIDGCWSKTTAK
jgi:hypothetical protein